MFKLATIGTIIISLLTISEAKAADYPAIILGQMTSTSVAATVNVLNSATSEDNVIIYIDSQGGEYFAGLDVLAAMENSKANVSCKVGSLAASAAALVLLGCYNNITVPDSAAIVFHLPYYPGDNGEKIRDQQLSSHNLRILEYKVCFSEILGNKYSDYATGGDVFLTGKEFKTLRKNGCLRK